MSIAMPVRRPILRIRLQESNAQAIGRGALLLFIAALAYFVGQGQLASDVLALRHQVEQECRP